MPVKLNTGRVHTPAVTPRDGNIPDGYVGRVVYSNDTSPSERVVYPVKDKALILAEPGEMTVITAYDLHPDDYVTFFKILRSSGLPAFGTPDCCPVIFISRSIVLRRALMDCWRVTSACPVFVLKTPGAYEVEIVGEKSAEAMITATSFKIQDINQITG